MESFPPTLSSKLDISWFGGSSSNKGGLLAAFQTFLSRALRFAPYNLSLSFVRFDVKLGCTFVIRIRGS